MARPILVPRGECIIRANACGRLSAAFRVGSPPGLGDMTQTGTAIMGELPQIFGLASRDRE